jgi:hypothetical protein
VTLLAENIYRSSNGDRWRLIRDTTTGRVFVRHEPNPSSGGRVTDTDVEEFLSVDGPGPEFAALRHILERPATDEQGVARAGAPTTSSTL